MKFRILPIILLLCACTTNVIQSTPEPTKKVFLPLVQRSESYPVIYDCEGDITTEEWLHEYYGAISWTQGVSGTLTALWSCCEHCAATMVVHVERNGEPVKDVPVMFYWADAPMLPLEKRNCGLDRGIIGPTNENGDVGFGLGGGSYYWIPNGGPHTVWTVGGPCVSGLGMKAATDHECVSVGISLP
jgi:hypothetical protein